MGVKTQVGSSSLEDRTFNLKLLTTCFILEAIYEKSIVSDLYLIDVLAFCAKV